MKDLAHCAECRTLAASGAVSLKIEGRKKSPLYVAAAVNYYRRLLDGTHGPGGRERAEADLKSIFSRPWTPLYLQSRMQAAVIDPHTTGHRGAPLGTVRKATRHSIRFITALPLELHDGIQVELPGETRPFGFAVEDIRLRDGRRVFEAAPHTEVEVPLPQQAPFIPPDTPLFLASSQAVKKRYRFEVPNPRDLKQRHPLRVKVQFSAQAVAVDAEATAGRFNAKVECRYKGPFEAAKKPDAMRQAVENAFSKLGDSPFTLDSIEQDGAPVFLPVSRLNTIRRDITEQLEQQVQQQRQEWLESVEADVAAAQNNTLEREESSPAQKEFLLKTDQPELILDMLKEGPLPPMTELIVELLDSTAPAIDILRKRLPEDIRLRLALPEVTRGWERDALQRHIRYFLDCGQTDWEISNISGLKFLPEAGLDIQADWPLYALNAQAIAEWQQRGIRRLTLSPEDTLENKTALAEAHPFQLMWAVQSDPPLFISENCPQDIGAGPCTGRRGCGFHAAWIKSRKDETLLLVNRGCRFYTLLEKPILELPPPHLPVIRRADFRLRPYTAETFRRQLDTLFA